MTDTLQRNHEQLLERVPLFRCLTASELALVADLCSERSYRKGSFLCHEGDEGDRFFIVLSGEIEVRTREAGDRVINRHGPGEYLGELALMTSGRRTASLRASKSARMLVLDCASFQRHFLRNAKVLEHMARVLGQRLANRERPDAGDSGPITISVLAPAGLLGKSLVANGVAGLLKEFSGRDVLMLTALPGTGSGTRSGAPRLSTIAEGPVEAIERIVKRGIHDPSRISVELDPDASAEKLGSSITELITHLRDRIGFAVLDVGIDGRSRELAEEVSDVIIEIVTNDEAASTAVNDSHMRRYRVLNLYNRDSEAISINRCDPFVIPVDAELRELDPSDVLAYLQQSKYRKFSVTLRRLARKIQGTSVGIALGGGAAFGIAHVGIFKVFEENDIPIDLIAGSSMGSIVAIGYAAGLRAAEMLEISRSIANVSTTLSALDFTLAKPGLLAGQRIIDIFAPLLGVETFEELTLPCQVVATDIRGGRSIHIKSGRLDTAFRASSSVPMLWSPVERDGHVLVDGAVLDPVPAELVCSMGADICIAVNAVPRIKEGVETILSRVYRQANRFNPLRLFQRGEDLPSSFDAVMNSIQLLQHELGEFKAISADVRINPDLSAYTWIEFYRALELIERGEEAAEQALPEIRRVLAEHAAAPAPI
jgi:NTE family protein